MRLFTKRMVLILIAVISLQTVFATGNLAFASNADVKAKISRLKKGVRTCKARIGIYSKKKKLLSSQLGEIRELLMPLPEGILRDNLQNKSKYLKKRIKICSKRVRQYTRRRIVLRNQIKALAARANALVLNGKASWYGGGIREHSLCAAMRGYRGKKVRVTNLANGKSVVVVINDYGPMTWTGRVIDLSKAAFNSLASTRQGVIGSVRLEVF